MPKNEIMMTKATERTMSRKHTNLSRRTRTLRVGPWNMRGIHSKKEELEREFESAGLDVLIVTETKKKVVERWKRLGCSKEREHVSPEPNHP